MDQRLVRVDLTMLFLSLIAGRGEQEERKEGSRRATSADGVCQRESAHRGEDHTEKNNK